MSKRKQTHETEVDRDEGSDDQETPDVVEMHFDYYNIDADNDYHAINRLFTQLFGPDAERVQTGPLTEVVTRVSEESGVGSTIKTEEEEGSDPYAVLTVVGSEHVERLMEYVLSKTRADEAFHAGLVQRRAEGRVGVVLSERLVNMPVQVMGPMYRLLGEELEAAGAGYRFTDYLFISRVYRPEAGGRETKRARPARAADGCGFHAEDEVIMEHAAHTTTYALADGDGAGPRLDVAGRAILVGAAGFRAAVGRIGAAYGDGVL